VSTRSERYLEAMQREFPGLRVIAKKDATLQRWTHHFLQAVTFGKMSAYMTHYTTVMGTTIYTPTGWETRSDDERYVTLRHEAVHLRQMKRYTKVGMAIIYGLPFFPVGLAYGRARIEWEAYAETLQAVADVYGIDVARSPQQREHIVRQFTSASYGWMWPFPRTIERWIDEELARIALRPKGDIDASP
jgi:hypothetical protein